MANGKEPNTEKQEARLRKVHKFSQKRFEDVPEDIEKFREQLSKNPNKLAAIHDVVSSADPDSPQDLNEFGYKLGVKKKGRQPSEDLPKEPLPGLGGDYQGSEQAGIPQDESVSRKKPIQEITAERGTTKLDGRIENQLAFNERLLEGKLSKMSEADKKKKGQVRNVFKEAIDESAEKHYNKLSPQEMKDEVEANLHDNGVPPSEVNELGDYAENKLRKVRKEKNISKGKKYVEEILNLKDKHKAPKGKKGKTELLGELVTSGWVGQDELPTTSIGGTVIRRREIEEHMRAGGFTQDQISATFQKMQEEYLDLKSKQKQNEYRENIARNAKGKFDHEKWIARDMMTKGIQSLPPEERGIAQKISRLRELYEKDNMEDGDAEKIQVLQEEIDKVYNNPGQLYDYKSGDYVDSEDAKEDVQSFNEQVKKMASKHKDTDLDKLIKKRNEAYFEMESVKDLYKKARKERGAAPEERFKTWDDTWENLKKELFRHPGVRQHKPIENEKGMNRWRELVREKEKKYRAFNRALMLNEDPADIERGIVNNLKLMGESISEEVFGFDVETNKDFVDTFVEQSREEGLEVTKEMQDRYENTIGEDVMESTGPSLRIMGEIVLSSLVLNKVTSVGKIAKYGKKFKDFLSTKYGKTGRVAYNMFNETARGTITFAPTEEEATTGTGEGFAQGIMTNMNVGKLSKLGKLGKALNITGRIGAGATVESVQELTGEYFNVMSKNGYNGDAAWEKVFGETPDEMRHKLAVIGLQSAMFSTAFNAPHAFMKDDAADYDVEKAKTLSEASEANISTMKAVRSELKKQKQDDKIKETLVIIDEAINAQEANSNYIDGERVSRETFIEEVNKPENIEKIKKGEMDIKTQDPKAMEELPGELLDDDVQPEEPQAESIRPELNEREQEIAKEVSRDSEIEEAPDDKQKKEKVKEKYGVDDGTAKKIIDNNKPIEEAAEEKGYISEEEAPESETEEVIEEEPAEEKKTQQEPTQEPQKTERPETESEQKLPEENREELKKAASKKALGLELTEEEQGLVQENEEAVEEVSKDYEGEYRQMGEDDLNQLIAEESTNPQEIEKVYNELKRNQRKPEDTSSKEDFIADNIKGRVSRESFKQFADPNLIGKNIGKAYLRKEGKPLDTLAKEISDASDQEVTEQDIVDFIMNNPEGVEQYEKSKKESSTMKVLRDKYQELTGKRLDLKRKQEEKQWAEQAEEDMTVDENLPQQIIDTIEKGRQEGRSIDNIKDQVKKAPEYNLMSEEEQEKFINSTEKYLQDEQFRQRVQERAEQREQLWADITEEPEPTEGVRPTEETEGTTSAESTQRGSPEGVREGEKTTEEGGGVRQPVYFNDNMPDGEVVHYKYDPESDTTTPVSEEEFNNNPDSQVETTKQDVSEDYGKKEEVIEETEEEAEQRIEEEYRTLEEMEEENKGQDTPTQNAIKIPGINMAYVQDVITNANITKFLKRQFRSRGLLPKQMFDKYIKMESAKKAAFKQAEYVINDLKKAIRKEYGKGFTIEDVKPINDYLAGQKDINELPESIRPIVADMRRQIDALSQKLIDDGVVQGDMKAAVLENMGIYMNRSYQVKDAPDAWNDYISKNPEGQAIRNRAVAFIMSNLKSDNPALNADQRKEKAEAYINELLHSEDGPMLVLQKGKVGSKDLSILKSRKDIPKPLRDVMGEYKDPIVNYGKSITKMATLLEHNKFLEKIRKEGEGTMFFKEGDPNRPSTHYKKVASEATKEYSPLNGYYTTPEMSDALEEMVASEKVTSTFLRYWMKGTGAVKYAKTVGSITTHFRNFIGNPMFLVANGHFTLGNIPEAAKTTFNDLKKSDKEKFRKKIDRYLRHGVLFESPRAGELEDVIDDATNSDWKLEGLFDTRLTKAKNKTLKVTTELYQAEDNFWKIAMFEAEVSRYSDAYYGKKYKDLTDEQKEEVDSKAANIVRNNMPTYSLVPKMVKSFRRNPLIGTFVSFPYEVARTSGNAVALSVSEMRSSNKKIKKIGAKRMGGILTAGSITTGLATMSSYMLGITDEEDENNRIHMAPWNKNSQLIYLGQEEETGNMKFIDMSFSDPYQYIKKPVMAVMRGESYQDKFSDGLWEMFSPFISEDILTQKFLDISRNKKASTGADVYNPEAPGGEQFADGLGHIMSALEPGTVSSFRRIWKGMNGEVSDNGKKYDPVQEWTALFGVRPQSIDLEKSMAFKASKYSDRVANAKKIYTTETYSKNRSRESLDRAYKIANEARKGIFDEIHRAYDAAVKLGADRNKILGFFKDRRFSERERHMIRTGEYFPIKKDYRKERNLP